jgi:hypothetical protein
MRVGRRARRLNDKNVAAAHVLVNLKVKLAIGKTLRDGAPRIATQKVANLFGQRPISITGEDLDAACCTHKLSDK